MAGGRSRGATSPHRRLWSTVFQLTTLVLVVVLISIQACSFALRRANSLGRSCIPQDKEYLSPVWAGTRIAMVSFSDEGRGGVAAGQMRPRTRSFQGLNKMVESNKEAYARKWGYGYINAWSLIDRSRPASWSKIPAIRSHLDRYDWVFWNDADSLVTNPYISLERILQSAVENSDSKSSPDLIVTEDVNGVNAGMFFVRRTRWSEEFLDTWWNMTAFITRGSTRSGDNAALIHLIRSLTPQEKQEHVYTAPFQCIFNSYPWVPASKSFYRLVLSPSVFWRGAYSQGDFMVHLAGLDDKTGWAKKILRELQVNFPSPSSV